MKISAQERRHILQLCFNMIDFDTQMLLKETAGDSGDFLLSTLVPMAKNSHCFEDLATEFLQNLPTLKVLSINSSLIREETSYNEDTLLKDIIDSHSWTYVAKKVLTENSLVNKRFKDVNDKFVNLLANLVKKLEETKQASDNTGARSDNFYYSLSDKKQNSFDKHVTTYLCELFKKNPEGFWLLYDFCMMLDAIEKQENNNVQRKAVMVYAAPSIAQALNLQDRLSSDKAHECHFLPILLNSIIKYVTSESNRLDLIKKISSHIHNHEMNQTLPRKPLRSRSRSQDKQSKEAKDLRDSLSKVTDELSQLHMDNNEQTSPKSKHKAKFSSPQPPRKTRNPVKRTMSVPGGLSFRSSKKPQ